MKLRSKKILVKVLSRDEQGLYSELEDCVRLSMSEMKSAVAWNCHAVDAWSNVGVRSKASRCCTLHAPGVGVFGSVVGTYGLPDFVIYGWL